MKRVFAMIVAAAGLCAPLWGDELEKGLPSPPAAPTLPGVAYVIPIDWSKFKCQPASGDSAERFGKILLNANKYALTTWWTERGFNQPAADGYLDFKGKSEHRIRPAASEAQGLAVSLRLGLYIAEATGVSRAEAERKALELIRSVAHRHRANSPNGWGKEWPKWLLEGKPSPTGRFTFTSWRLWKKNDALVESGLLGPVTLQTTAGVPSAP